MAEVARSCHFDFQTWHRSAELGVVTMKRLPSRTYLATIHPQDAADILDAFERDERQYYPDDDNTDVSYGRKSRAYYRVLSARKLKRVAEIRTELGL